MKDGHCREWRAPVMKVDYQAELKKKDYSHNEIFCNIIH